ncbi:MAG: site-specific integrase [Planctomycetaceae bacterium]|nr:site-specific integrase [Planctomycetaceae bacterium]
MASVFRRFYTKLDPATGERVRKKTPKWYGEYKDENGVKKRVPLCTDKAASQTMLNQLVVKAERRRVGISDPSEDEVVRPIQDHISEYERYLLGTGATEKHAAQVAIRLTKLCRGCGFLRISDIDANKLTVWLAEQRRTQQRFSRRTSNFYQDNAKSFCRWLKRQRRITENPLEHLQRLNVETDRRHFRRALSSDEFSRIVEAAKRGKRVEGIEGRDRAMLYVLAAWTGYRRGELASLTLQSFNFESDPPTVSVKASYSKRRRMDCIPLHSVVLEMLQNWLETKGGITRESQLFPLQWKSGHFRKTSKMMKTDLESARNQWIGEGESPEEQQRRRDSGFLSYQNEAGLYADFHANRHTFISNLARMGVSPKLAQTLARHSDINLTMNVYSHLELADQALAVASLPAPPQILLKDGASEESLALPLAQTPDISRREMASNDSGSGEEGMGGKNPNSRNDTTLCMVFCTESGVHPRGLEPLTFGSVDRIPY